MVFAAIVRNRGGAVVRPRWPITAVVVPDFEDPDLICAAGIELERIVAQVLGLVRLIARLSRYSRTEADVQRCVVSTYATVLDQAGAIERTIFAHVQQTHHSRVAVQSDLVAEHRHILHTLVRRHDPRRSGQPGPRPTPAGTAISSRDVGGDRVVESLMGQRLCRCANGYESNENQSTTRQCGNLAEWTHVMILLNAAVPTTQYAPSTGRDLPSCARDDDGISLSLLVHFQGILVVERDGNNFLEIEILVN